MLSAYVDESGRYAARALCLSSLLSELSARGIASICIESRGAQLDDRDRAVLTGLRRAGQVRPGLEVMWKQKSQHAGLWAADCLAGAVGSWLDGDESYWVPVQDRVDILEVDEG